MWPAGAVPWRRYKSLRQNASRGKKWASGCDGRLNAALRLTLEHHRLQHEVAAQSLGRGNIRPPRRIGLLLSASELERGQAIFALS